MRPEKADSGAIPESMTATPMPAPLELSPAPSVLRRKFAGSDVSCCWYASAETSASTPIDSTFGSRAISARSSPRNSAVNPSIDACLEKIRLSFLDKTCRSTLLSAPVRNRTMTRCRWPPCASWSTRSSLDARHCAPAGGEYAAHQCGRHAYGEKCTRGEFHSADQGATCPPERALEFVREVTQCSEQVTGDAARTCPSDKDCHARIWHTAAMTKFAGALPNCLTQMEYQAKDPFRNAVVPVQHNETGRVFTLLLDVFRHAPQLCFRCVDVAGGVDGDAFAHGAVGRIASCAAE